MAAQAGLSLTLSQTPKTGFFATWLKYKLDRVKRIWDLSPMRAAKVQASLRIRAVSPEPSLLAHTSSESRGTFRQKARSLAPLNGWACAVKICHDGMLEDTNSLDGAQLWVVIFSYFSLSVILLVPSPLCSTVYCYLLGNRRIIWPIILLVTVTFKMRTIWPIKLLVSGFT